MSKTQFGQSVLRKLITHLILMIICIIGIVYSLTDMIMDYKGITSLNESLKSNTTLTELNLSGEGKRKKTRKRHPKTIHSAFLFASTGNEIGDTGAASLSEALKSNTTLTKLDLSGEDKRKKTHKTHSSTNKSSSITYLSTENGIRDTGATSLSESLKSNTTIVEHYLRCEDQRKKTHKRHPKAKHSFPFS